MGGKSSSSNSTSTTQSTTTNTKQADVSGVTSGDILQGEITYTNNFGPEAQKAFQDMIASNTAANHEVGAAFEELINLSNKAVEGAAQFGTAALGVVAENAKTAQTAIANNNATSQTPNLSTIQSLVPILMLGVAGIVFMNYGK